MAKATALGYIVAREAMCIIAFRNCARCPFAPLLNDGRGFTSCLDVEREHLDQAIEVVKRWKEEQDELRH